MRLTYIRWGYEQDEAVIRAMEELGLEVDAVDLAQGTTPEALPGAEGMTAEAFGERIGGRVGDIVFTINFFGGISDWCQREGIPYCCWVLLLPNFDLYTSAVRNACNYLGVCDSYLVEKLWQAGVSKAFFLPEGVELGKPVRTEPMEREVCFIGRFPGQILCTEGMSLYGKGYLEAFLHAQRVLYGVSILEEGLLSRVQKELMACSEIPSAVLPELQKLFVADRYLAPVCTGLQQKIFFQNFDTLLTLYSDGDFPDCKAVKREFVEDADERRRIYAEKEFTLVLAPHVMHNAMPRDTLEVIAAGGFPLCGFQKDYAYFFERDKNLVYFTNAAEFSQAVVRYGNNHEERERVRTAAYQEIAEKHTYRQRITAMLEMWEKL